MTDNSPDHPYMANWWVPGLAIGYDASFTHQVADFIQGLETGKPPGPDVPGRPGNAVRPRRDPRLGEEPEVGERGEELRVWVTARRCIRRMQPQSGCSDTKFADLFELPSTTTPASP